MRPGGGDAAFVAKLESLQRAHAAFRARRTSRVHFSVVHYAGAVEV